MNKIIEYSRPTRESPMLVGLLVDVSGSMTSSINNRSGENINRLQSFEKALGNFANRASDLSKGHGKGLIKVFAYGFGFGGLGSIFFGDSGPDVRDLLKLPGNSNSLVAIDELASEWKTYQSHVQTLSKSMFGSTPMGGGFREVISRFKQETTRNYSAIVLFVVSDGEPTDASYNDIVKYSDELKRMGVLIISCLVTDSDIAKPRHIYGTKADSWPKEAGLMFDCASTLPQETPYEAYMQEHKWQIEANGRLFTQINQSEVLSEFLNMLASPLQDEVVVASKEISASSIESKNDIEKGEDPKESEVAKIEVHSVALPKRTNNREYQNEGRLLTTITHWTFATGIVVSIIGVLLIVVGGAGTNSSVDLFGQSIKTTNVGVTTVFIGVMMVIMNIRRVLKSFDRD